MSFFRPGTYLENFFAPLVFLQNIFAPLKFFIFTLKGNVCKNGPIFEHSSVLSFFAQLVFGGEGALIGFWHEN